MICDNKKIIFIHIPKTAGTSIEYNLFKPQSERTKNDLWGGFVDKWHNIYQSGGLQHLTALLVKYDIGNEKFKSYFKFCVVRNPYDKAISAYHYMIQKRNDIMQYYGFFEEPSFLNYLKRIAEKHHVQSMPQHKFIFDENEKSMIDFIMKYENLETDYKILCKLIDVNYKPLRHFGNSKRERNINNFLKNNKGSIELINVIYSKDFDLLGYEKLKEI